MLLSILMWWEGYSGSKIAYKIINLTRTMPPQPRRALVLRNRFNAKLTDLS